MKNSESPVIDSNNALTWPADVPSVAMDIDLGRKGYNERSHRIDFDMAKYYKLLSNQRLSSEQMSKLKVMIHDTEHTHLNGLIPDTTVYGEYLPDEKLVHVRLVEPDGNKPQSENIDLAQTNNTLLHETRHSIQDARGTLVDTELGRKLMWYGLRYVVPIGVLAGGALVNKVSGSDAVPPISEAIAAHVAGRMLTGYQYRLCEIGARHFTSKNMANYGDIISVKSLAKVSENKVPESIAA